MWPFKRKAKKVEPEPTVGPRSPAGAGSANSRREFTQNRREEAARRNIHSYDEDAVYFDTSIPESIVDSDSSRYETFSPITSYDSTPSYSSDSGSSSSGSYSSDSGGSSSGGGE